ncbi:hypothetical protein ACH5RR_000370 [Cinchona calisaya]|uniref:PGG domain-containing protein n=1 Tax=Cinchona calisaya TaxID=153742 RepID=A0ABD3B1F8_9GENT
MEIVVGDDEVREESSPSRFQGLGIKRKIRKQRWKTRTQILPLQVPSSQAPKQESNTTPPFHPVFKFLIPSLLAVVAFKYQGSSEDPSKTHPLQTWSFVLAIFIYSLITSFAITIKQPQNQSAKFLQFLKLAALASGVVSSLLLVSLLLPRFPGLILLYTSWALFAIILAWPILQMATCNWLLRGTKIVLDVLMVVPMNSFTGWNFIHRPPPQEVAAPPV